MIVGHAFLAFILVSLLAKYLGKENRKSLLLGFYAGLFAVIPDIDIIYAWKEILIFFTSNLTSFVEEFWNASRTVHRGISHSYITLLLGLVNFTLYRKYRNKLIIGISALIFAFYGYFLVGEISMLVNIAFVFSGILLTEISFDKTNFREFLMIVFIGLFSHPLGDLFTGTPPELFFPLNLGIFLDRVVLISDPVLNLLSLFLIEVGLVAISLAIIIIYSEIEINQLISPMIFNGLIFLILFNYIPNPTLEVSYQFVYSIVGFGILNTYLIYLLSSINLKEISQNDILILSTNLVATLIISATSFTLAYISSTLI